MRDYVASLKVDDKTKEAILETMQLGSSSGGKGGGRRKSTKTAEKALAKTDPAAATTKIDTSIFNVSKGSKYKPEAIKASKYLKAFTTKTKNMNTLKIEDVVKAMLNNPYYTAEMKKNARKIVKK